MKYALQLAYKGTNYHGWQIQENAHSVQAELNRALETLLKHPVKTLGSGRTDKGVHAKEQYAMFDSIHDLNSFDHLLSINSLLPKDISVFGIFRIGDEANVRFDAIERVYEYRICRQRDPFELETCAFLFSQMDKELLNRGAEYLLTQKNFAAFAKSGSDQRTSICNINRADWKFNDHLWTFEIAADRFLRNMVRAIVGSMVELAEGKIDLKSYKKIFESDKRSRAGRSVPAEGLFLKKVTYPERYFQDI